MYYLCGAGVTAETGFGIGDVVVLRFVGGLGFVAAVMSVENLDRVLRTERMIGARAEKVFGAFERADLLARWWGPKGFTNTFEVFEFRPGGRWVFMMHAPNGANFHNENVFREIERERRIVLEHTVTPWFRLTVTLTPNVMEHGEATHLEWAQEFESAEMAEKVRARAATANEEVLDRLEEVVRAEWSVDA
jgi:uncharacterized protein YndB with AHSA1/START domain